MAVDEAKACVLAARNLALAEKAGQQMMAPCAACYLVLNKTKHYFHDYPKMRARIDLHWRRWASLTAATLRCGIRWIS